MDTSDELRMLRARAYGPSADIDADPEALARLAELERATPPITTPAAGATTTLAEPVPVRGEISTAATEGVPGRIAPEPVPEEADPDSPPAGRGRPGAPRWTAILWPVSVIAALALGAATTSAAMPLVSRAGGSAQVATLLPDPAYEWPEEFFGAPSGAVGYQEFFGLRALTVRGDRFLPNGADACMLLIPTAELPSEAFVAAEPTDYACSAGAFPTTVVLTVGEESPDELRSRFPAGSALQFVFDGDRVGVFSDAEG